MSREHHYHFAHRYLPHCLFEGSGFLLKALFKADEGFALHHLQCGREVIGEHFEGNERLSADGLSFTRHFLANDVAAAVIQFPQPVEPVEAYMAAIVYRPERKLWFRKQKGILRYMTLEMGQDEGRNVTVLCEWRIFRKDEQISYGHGNFGIGPAATPAAFVTAIDALLSRSGYQQSSL